MTHERMVLTYGQFSDPVGPHSCIRNHEDCTYLCAKCGLNLGGRWPEGHTATMCEGTCDSCGSIKILSHHDDWNWPGQNTYPGRD